MKSARIVFLGVLIFIFAFSTLAYAGVPQMINYQGKLTTPQGALIDDTLSIVFTVYDAATGGIALWTETQATVIVEKGIFSVLLGSVNPIPDSVFPGDVRYLGVKVEADPEMTPRKEIVSVGYAYKAEYSDTAEYSFYGAPDDDWDLDTAGINVYRLTGNVGIGTATPEEKLDVAGTAQVTGFKMPTSASDGYVLTSDASGVGTWQAAAGGGGWADDGNAVRLETATDSVGIGTATPSEKLEVSGNIKASGTITSGSSITIDGATDKITATGGTIDFDNENLQTTGNADVGGFKMTTGAGTGKVLTSDGSGVGTWQAAAGGADNDWTFRVTDTADTTLMMGGEWGIARFGNVLYGNADSTHVNLGVACTTGMSGENLRYSTVGGGLENTAGHNYTTVGGGYGNTASYGRATVGGGYFNTASGFGSTIGGGESDTASGSDATVGGGQRNTASGSDATVGGGGLNTASGTRATVAGGWTNIASEWGSTVAGGQNDTASAAYSTVGGGRGNAASGWIATIGGGQYNTATTDQATVGGGHTNTASGLRATVGGGLLNTASGTDATVGGGQADTASGDQATVGGGLRNTASATNATVGGGYSNAAIAFGSTVGGGVFDTASSNYATVGGGYSNTASGWIATVGGGHTNTASGEYATVPGGRADTAAGDFSLAAGDSVRISSDADFTFAFGRNFTTSTPNAVIFHNSVNPIKLGIGTTAPDEELHVQGSIKMVDGNQAAGKVLTSDANGVGTWQASAAGGIGGSGTANYVPKFTASTTLGNSAIYETGSRIGIGTTTPDTYSKLHVQHNNRYAGYFTSNYLSNATDVIRSEFTGSGNYDAAAVHGVSWPADGYGYGGWFAGGYAGVYAGVFSEGSAIYCGVDANAVSGSGMNVALYGWARFSTDQNYGVYAVAQGGNYDYGVYGAAAVEANSWAGYFYGNAKVTGTLTKGGGSFQIDHPLDPENKYLFHSFVESPDMMNVYNGNVILDATGEATVELPDYFEALNRDFRYQLTAIGAPGPNLYISQEISGNSFKIAGGEPGMKVSWQVTGIRHDKFAEANRIQVEVDKPAEEQGKYLHPEAYKLGQEYDIHYEQHKQMKEREQRKLEGERGLR